MESVTLCIFSCYSITLVNYQELQNRAKAPRERRNRFGSKSKPLKARLYLRYFTDNEKTEEFQSMNSFAPLS